MDTRATDPGSLLLVCPADGSLLESRLGRRCCGCCGVSYPDDGGVVRFLSSEDAFYEGSYTNRIRFVPRGEYWWQVWPLWLIHSGYLWRVRSWFPAGSRLLELGAAGGAAYLARRYRMIAADVSLSSLKAAAEDYTQCLQLELRDNWPLPPASVDGVISACFWEHITPSDKERILGHCRRVLKPGGRLLFVYDVATENSLIGGMKRSQPELYRRLFIEGDGHVGYQTIAENEQIFRSAGFSVLYSFGVGRTWVHTPDVYHKLARGSGWYARLSRLARITRTPRLRKPYESLVRVIDETCGRLWRKEKSRIAVSVCERSH